mmetsp:Transcript_9447/g.14496  ORF Transcript_9447/g.14496 Transcript_9447/m.14496 type:complete len:215 (-) Transcript_9447:388-1032(-)
MRTKHKMSSVFNPHPPGLSAFRRLLHIYSFFQGYFSSESDAISGEDALDRIERGHLAALELRVLERTVDVDLKGATLHQLGLQHGAHEEQGDADLPLVALNVIVQILDGVGHRLNASEEPEHPLTGEEEDEPQEPNPPDEGREQSLGAGHLVVLASDADVGHEDVVGVSGGIPVLVVVNSEFFVNKLLHLHKRLAVRSPDAVLDVHVDPHVRVY